MNQAFKRWTNHLVVKPKTLFLIDGIGAFITALSLLIILLSLNDWFGIPESTLILLSSLALCFSLYSMSCYVFLQRNWVSFIRIISFANLFYCLLTLGLLFVHYEHYTVLAGLYFLIETAVILGLVYLELYTARKLF